MTINEALTHNITFEQMGFVISGSTNEVRAMVLGNLASVGGNAYYDSIHQNLRNLGYDKLHIFKPRENVLKTCLTTPDSVVTTDELQERIILSTELGAPAVAFSGVLVEQLPREENIGFNKLTGIYKPSTTTDTPSTTIRRVVLDMLATGASVKRARVVSIGSETANCNKGMIRKHIERLLDTGMITIDEGAYLKVGPEFANSIRAYTELVSAFETDEQLRRHGYEYMTAVSSGKHVDSRLLPALAKRSVVQSGKSMSPALDIFVTSLSSLVDRGEVVTSTEIASRFGQPTHVVFELLQRMERVLDKTPIRRVNEPESGKSRVREREWIVAA
jgi:hypothetical protein